MREETLEDGVGDGGAGRDLGLEDVAGDKRERIAHDEGVAVEDEQDLLRRVEELGDQLMAVAGGVGGMEAGDGAELDAVGLEGGVRARLRCKFNFSGMDRLLDCLDDVILQFGDAVERQSAADRDAEIDE